MILVTVVCDECKESQTRTELYAAAGAVKTPGGWKWDENKASRLLCPVCTCGDEWESVQATIVMNTGCHKMQARDMYVKTADVKTAIQELKLGMHDGKF